MASIRCAGRTLFVSGRLTVSTVMALLEPGIAVLKDQQVEVVDLAAVDYLDSAGLALFVEWIRSAPELTFVSVPEQAKAYLNLTNMVAIIRIEES